MTAPKGEPSGAWRVLYPLRDFFHTEAAGGVVLVAATAAALVWANAAPSSYDDLWSTVFSIGTDDHSLSLTLRAWVNDGLMAIFFFVVGLEIKRELVEGELRQPRQAALPVIAAIGGMVVPALVYVTFNAGGPGSDGWGIPMATDIAMAIGVLSLLGNRVPSALKLFVLALAIVDDIGAILVIALFYSDDFNAGAALAAGGFLAAMLVLRAMGVRRLWPFVVLGVGVWVAIHEGGVHATIAGVVLGLLTPTRPFRQADMVDADVLTDLSTVERAHETEVHARESVSLVEWLEHRIHPWSSYVIIPTFALANAGVVISRDSLDAAVSSPITHGIVVGLVVGKLVGISLFTWIACRIGIASMPRDARMAHIIGVAALAGIGFTVSLFIAELAFGANGLYTDEAKLGILAASIIAGALGCTLLLRLPARDEPTRAAAEKVTDGSS
ncbi:MAG: Na+/H+ antiporter NhaA [Acidimicrobiia bacterium]